MVKGGPIPCGFEKLREEAAREETAFNIMAASVCATSNLSFFKIKAVCSDITPASSCTKGKGGADALMLVDQD